MSHSSQVSTTRSASEPGICDKLWLWKLESFHFEHWWSLRNDEECQIVVCAFVSFCKGALRRLIDWCYWLDALESLYQTVLAFSWSFMLLLLLLLFMLRMCLWNVVDVVHVFAAVVLANALIFLPHWSALYYIQFHLPPSFVITKYI